MPGSLTQKYIVLKIEIMITLAGAGNSHKDLRIKAYSGTLRLCSHGTGPKWIRPYLGTDHFCSHGTVPLINVCPHGTGQLLFGTESK